MLIVSGKGGVGRTTVSAALAVAATRSGKRVLIAQMDGHERLGALLGHSGPIGPDIVTVAEGLDAVNMNARAALREYGLMTLRYETIYKAVFENRPVRSFLSAVPGLDAYSMLGKAWYHTTEMHGERRRYDLVIVDAPASGHATSMLRIPGAVVEAMPRGPLARDARAMLTLLRSPDLAAFVIVTLPEELPVSETTKLAREARESLRLPLGPLVVNAMPAKRWGEPALVRTLNAASRPLEDAQLERTVAGARVLAARRRDAERMLARLESDPALPIITLPRFYTPSLGPGDIERMSARLRDV